MKTFIGIIVIILLFSCGDDLINESQNTGTQYLPSKPPEPTEKCSKPIFIDNGLSSRTVEISTSTTGAVIYYTTDKSNPNINGILYTTPIILEIGFKGKVKAIALKSGYITSDIGFKNYNIK